MRILAIRIKNLTSLAGEIVVDFTADPLASAGIFAITGPTGSGKSTILDGLCLALYGKAPRYKGAESGIEVRDVAGSTIAQGDVRGILRDGTVEGYAEADFVGVDQQYYRARWSVRRARGRMDGSLQQVEISLRNLSTDVLIPGKKTELQQRIEQLLGLSFEQFTRSVLLAQGDFKAFLEANKDEKASLLEKLTGQQIYSEISKRIFERHREENQLLQNLRLRRGEIPTLTTEELAEYGRQKGELVIQIREAEQVIMLLTAEISWYEELNLLQFGRNEAYQGHELAVTAQRIAVPRGRYLQEVESVQVVRPLVERLHELKDLLAEKIGLFQLQLELLLKLTAQQETIEQVLQEAELELKKHSEQLEGAHPGLDRAKVLDVLLVGKAEQIKQVDEELQTVVGHHEELKRVLETSRREADSAAEEITHLIEWKTDNAGWQVVAVNENLIFSKLQDATGLLEKLQKLTAAVVYTDQNSERLEKEGREWETLEGEKAEGWEKVCKEYERNDTALKAASLEALEKDKLLVDSVLVELSEASNRWGLLWAAQQELDRVRTKLGEREHKLEHTSNALVNTEKELAAAGLKKDVSRSILEKMELTASENVETMRARLIEDEPCPVCGSTHHPYASENRLFDQVLADLNTVYKEHEQTHDKYLKEQGSLQQATAQLTEEIGTLQKDQAGKDVQLQELEKAWTACLIYEEGMKQPAGGRTRWLQGQRNQALEKQTLLQDQVRAAHELQQQVEINRDLRDKLEKELMKIREEIKDNKRGQVSIGEKQEQQNKDLLEATRGLGIIEEQLKEYFPSDKWFAGWKNEQKGVEQEIRACVVKWRANGDALDKNLLTQRTLEVAINNQETQLVGIDVDRKRNEGQLGDLNAQSMVLRREREQLFAGRAVSAVEQDLKATVEKARKVLEARRREKEDLGTVVIRATTEKEQNEAAILQLKEHQARVEGEIREWLSDYNRSQQAGLSSENLVELLEVASDWRRGEQTALRMLDDAVTRAETVWQERESLLAAHIKEGWPEREKSELGMQLKKSRLDLEGMIRQLHEIDFRLHEDAEHKAQIGELLQEIAAQGLVVENWAKLNDVVGSSDGKKFRQVAQEYTLDVLLRFSNVHLSRLSSRYILQRIPNTLGLQVVDLDMGNEVRTVISLSGGESFLVSLSLALGLASLTSSQMRVESLFIDEGFGSLDPNTLNIAMDALERLHQQGRKVGVISHVQEMTERIPVQIRVSKERSGGSRVEIVGG